MRCLLVENYHQFPSALDFGSLPQFFARFRAQQTKNIAGRMQEDCMRLVYVVVTRRTLISGFFVVVAFFFFFSVQPRPLLSSHVKICESYRDPAFFLNLPGWRWGSITQNPLVAVSRPLHSGVCETRQDIGLPVLHSEISDSGLLRTRGDQQSTTKRLIQIHVDPFCFVFFFFRVASRVFVARVLCISFRVLFRALHVVLDMYIAIRC